MKKLLALILAASMILCLVPAAGAEASSDESYDYLFKNSVFEAYAENTGTNQMGSATNHGIDTCRPKADCGSDPWGFVSATITRGNASTMPTKTRLSYYFNNTDSAGRTEDWGEVINNGDGTWSYNVLKYNPEDTRSLRALVLEIDVPSAGTFNPVFNYISDGDNSILEFFIIDKEKAAYNPKNALGSFLIHLDPRDRVGIVDTYSAEANSAAEAVMPAVTIPKAGRYYLVMLINGTNRNVAPYNKGTNYDANGNQIAYSYMEFYSFHLKRKPADVAIGTTYDYKINHSVANISTRDNPSGIDDGKAYLIPDAKDYARVGYVRKLSSTSFQWRSMSLAEKPEDNYVYLKPDQTDMWSIVKENSMNNCYVDANEYYANANSTSFGNGYWPFVAIVLKVPASGEYSFETTSVTKPNGANVNVYFLPLEGVPADVRANLRSKLVHSHFETSANYVGTYDTFTESGAKTLGSVTVNAPGEYLAVFEWRTPDEGVPPIVSGDFTYYDGNVREIKLTKTAHVDDGSAEKIAKQNVSPDNAEAESIDISGVEVIAKLEDSNGDSIGSDISGTVVDNIATIEAPEVEGYKFLDWENADGETVCDTASYSFKISENTKLTAVYLSTGADKVLVSYYNGNGDILARFNVDRNSEITLPPLPSMAGYETAEKWIFVNDSAEYDAGAKIATNWNRMTFVAKYSEDDAVSGIKVKINGATSTYSYGELVTATAAARDADNATLAFAYWTKNGEIVSFDKTYSFNAWEDCELESVYETFVPLATEVRKILLGEISVSVDSAKHVMAEFIGCEDAIERGIIFGNTSTITLGGESVAKATAKTDKKLFTASYVDGSYARGYAIFKNGSATEIIYSDAK